MTRPFSDWPHLSGGPDAAQVAAAHDLYRRAAATPTLSAMNAELRHLYDNQWSLELVGERDGHHVVGFSEDIPAPPGSEREAATARLVRAGQPDTWVWTQVAGGWDGKRA